jgi:hypothetical protein
MERLEKGRRERRERKERRDSRLLAAIGRSRMKVTAVHVETW